MAEDGHEGILVQLSSNSNSNTTQSRDRFRLLEARMIGPGGISPSTPVESMPWGMRLNPPPPNASLEAAGRGTDSDSDEEAGDFSIQVNPLKRKSLCEDSDLVLLNLEGNHTTRLEAATEEKPALGGKKSRTSQGGVGRVAKASGGLIKSNSPLRNGPRRGVADNHLKAARPGTINDYFRKQMEEVGGDMTTFGRSSFVEQDCQTEVSFQEVEASLVVEREGMQEEVAAVRDSLRATEEELARVKQEAEDTQAAYEKLQKELQEYKELQQQRDLQKMRVVADVLVAEAKAERQEARRRLRQDSVRLGNIGVMRAGTVISEVWEDGQAFKDMAARLQRVMEARAAVERSRKELKKKGHTAEGEGAAGPSEDELAATEEIFRTRLAALKKEEETIARDRERCEIEKSGLIREMKRIRDEDASRFNHFSILHKRYALLNLLGKGGFSEVYKAFDLVEYRFVACKLHQLNTAWSEDKKQSYVRHAIREYHIHKKLNHPRIVRLFDIFEIDNNTFCTVLEYCEGKDLDAVLKATPVLGEREARCLIVQIFAGLAYLNAPQHRVIHYDLKPGNILFNAAGEVKITDFGLSKVMEEEGASQGMELTSQGAGTYWYLPPECFEIGKQPPMISSKVDVWSAGVILYQMLFGKRPFGHDQTQEKILREETIRRARTVEFPAKPPVSQEAKEFIRRCLAYNQPDRPDVLKAVQDPYLSYGKKKG